MDAERNQTSRDFENDTQLVLGLDTGRRRCGVARADASLTLASPLGVVPTLPFPGLAERIGALLVGSQVRLVVAGLPLDHYGNEGPACEFARQAAQSVADGLGCSLEFVDERFTTKLAERSREHARKGQHRPENIDAWAAAAILQAYLDRRRSG